MSDYVKYFCIAIIETNITTNNIVNDSSFVSIDA